MNILILLYLIAISPKLLSDRVFKGKRHPGLLQRLGLQLPKTSSSTIWIHAVSVGEVKAAAPLILQIRKRNPFAFILVTTTTFTGQEEAKRSLKADAYAYLPIDLSPIVSRWVKKINPKHFILIENDIWPNLLNALVRNKTRISLVSAKMSDRSAKRFHFFLRISKKIFSSFDHICLQDESYLKHFKPLSSSIHITGNLKLDSQPQATVSLPIPKPAITISCTHPQEEKLLLEALLPSKYFVILAPRHPERFREVAALLEQKKIAYSRWKDGVYKGNLLLVDAMGKLSTCYANSRLAILGGSFVPDIGGHNVLEPILYNTPVFFGPYMQGQKYFALCATKSGAGKQVLLEELKDEVERFFEDGAMEINMKKGAFELMASEKGAAERTAAVIFSEKVCQ